MSTPIKLGPIEGLKDIRTQAINIANTMLNFYENPGAHEDVMLLVKSYDDLVAKAETDATCIARLEARHKVAEKLADDYLQLNSEIGGLKEQISKLKEEAELGRIALGYADRAESVALGKDDPKIICAEFSADMLAAIMRHVAEGESR